MEMQAYLSNCKTYRWALSRIWNNDKPLLMFVMLNPSTADANVDDPTIRRCIRFAAAWGYGGIYVCNLFAFRSTDPKALKTAVDPVGELNDEWIQLIRKRCAEVVYAWGTNGGLMNRYAAVCDLIPGGICLGTTQHGFPKHPLYVRADMKPLPYLPY